MFSQVLVNEGRLRVGSNLKSLWIRVAKPNMLGRTRVGAEAALQKVRITHKTAGVVLFISLKEHIRES